MNIAPKIMHFPVSAFSSVRAAFGTVLVCTCLLGGVIHPARAESGGQNGQSGQSGRRDDGFRDATRDASREAQRAQQAQQFQAQSRRGQDNRGTQPGQPDPRAYDARADEQRRTMQSAEPARRSGRLTPDERRDLRRQINEAGQDIYAAPPRR